MTFKVGMEVEVHVLPWPQSGKAWVRTIITGGPHPHPGGNDCVTWDVPLDCGYRFEDEMRLASAPDEGGCGDG